jgi:hypothetical protein
VITKFRVVRGRGVLTHDKCVCMRASTGTAVRRSHRRLMFAVAEFLHFVYGVTNLFDNVTSRTHSALLLPVDVFNPLKTKRICFI